MTNIRHFVIEGSSQWVIGRNVTSVSNIIHIGNNAIEIIDEHGIEYISMINRNRLSYIPISSFKESAKTNIVSKFNGITVKDIPWKEVTAIIDKVHRHVCGHANLTDIRVFLQRNKMWNNAVEKYVSDLVSRCTACRSTAPPQPSRKVSISNLSKGLNEVVCIDHLYLESVRMFHAMDLVTRYSAAFVVGDATMEKAIHAFESCWINQFWIPDEIKADKAFINKEFEQYCKDRDIKISPIPPQRHSKNAVESKHGIIRSIFLKLQEADPHTDLEMIAVRAVTVSNDLYGNDVLSSFEQAKGYTKPINGNPPKTIPDDIIEAQENLSAKRKLAMILKSKATIEEYVSVGDMIEVYHKTGMKKKGVWSTPKIVLSVDHDSRSVTVPGRAGKRSTVALEDIRKALPENSFEETIQLSLDKLEESIEDELLETSENENIKWDYENDDDSSQSNEIQIATEDADFSGNGPIIDSEQSKKVARGDHIEVFWPLDDTYYSGVVKHLHQNGEVTVLYNDGAKERLQMDKEIWKHCCNAATANAVGAKDKESSSEYTVKNMEPYELQRMYNFFGNKPFLRFQAQGFEQYVITSAYKQEEESFLKTVKLVPKEKVPENANIIRSHTLYKIKVNDDSTMKLTARIAPHGNEDAMRHELKTDCATCSTAGLRILESISALFGWKVIRVDAKTAFLQTGEAQREVYVIPPVESGMRKTHFWLLMAAEYGLVNSNAKWQAKSDERIYEIGLKQSQNIPQLFYMHDEGKLVLIAAKIVDDIKLAGTEYHTSRFIKMFNKSFKLGTVVKGPGSMRFFGINIEQDEDNTITTDAEDKLNDLTEYCLSRTRRKQFGSSLNQIEKNHFASINSSLGWIGTAASPFCSFYASFLQQKTPDTNVSHLVDQINIVKKLQKLGTNICYPRPNDKKKYNLTVLAFADASKPNEYGQIGVIVGLLVGEFAQNSIYHPVSWLSHKSKRPTKSVPAAEILATTEAIDEVKMICNAYREILRIKIETQICVDSKDLFTSLSTQRNSIDRSMRNDVSCIRFKFQVGSLDKITWLPGKLNLADALTKQDSPLTEALRLTLYTGRLQLEFERNTETKTTEKNYG